VEADESVLVSVISISSPVSDISLKVIVRVPISMPSSSNFWTKVCLTMTTSETNVISKLESVNINFSKLKRIAVDGAVEILASRIT